MSCDVSIPSEPSLIEYPSQFPIKVMGANAEGLTGAVIQIAKQFDPDFAKVAAVWPRLPEPIRRAVLALIVAAEPG